MYRPSYFTLSILLTDFSYECIKKKVISMFPIFLFVLKTEVMRMTPAEVEMLHILVCSNGKWTSASYSL